MAADPLESLHQQIRQAAELPAAEPYVPSGEPLDRLRAHLRGEDPAAANDDRPGRAPDAGAEGGGGFETLIGREVLAMLASDPLPADAREEAARRVVVAMQNPAPDNLRSVLRVLITGRADA